MDVTSRAMVGMSTEFMCQNQLKHPPKEFKSKVARIDLTLIPIHFAVKGLWKKQSQLFATFHMIIDILIFPLFFCWYIEFSHVGICFVST